MSIAPQKAWLPQVLFILLVYFVTGKLGLILALPPGYASLVWAPMGLSIAALLLFGINRWPGVLLGAFFVNIHSLERTSDLLLAMGISIGNTVAVVAAVLLIQRTIHFPKRPFLEREALLFLLLAGPIAALISASNGVLVLHFAGQLPARDLLTNWLHWYVGDASGAMIFAPVALLIATQSRRNWLPSIAKILIPVCSTFMLVILASHYFRLNEHEKMTSEFARKSEFTYNALDRNLSANIEMLQTLRSFYQSSVDITAQEFRDFAEKLHDRHPEVQALAWVPQQKVTYVEPLLTNPGLLGYDFASDPVFLELLKKADASSELVTSIPLTLPEHHPLKKKLFILLSVKQHKGVLMQVLKIDSILKDLNEVLADPSYRVLIEDVTDNKRLTVLDSKNISGSSESDAQFTADFAWSSHIQVGDRIWEVALQQDTSLLFGARLNFNLFLLASLVFMFLICSLLLTIASRIITVEEIVDEKTLHLMELNQQLKKASEKKSAFLANMSHEIRTPLNVIIGTSDILKESPLNPEQRHYLEVSQKAGHNLLNIINDILDISKIEAGLVTLEQTEVNLHEIVREVLEMFALRCQEKKIQLSSFLDQSTQNIYLGDPTRIRQILANLVSNAIKFTSQGTIHLELRRNDTELPGNLLFRVRDTGIGIASDKISQLFQPFTQADSTITRKFGGTGLGLSISRHLIEMMNGMISIESELQKGSCFTFTLDLPCVREATAEASITVAAPDVTDSSARWSINLPLNILVVDDSEDNRSLIRAYLKKSPHKISDAVNGKQALDMVHTFTYDLILMDMQMPVMDGFTATRKIRRWEADNQKEPTPIWALTAYALPDEITRSLQSGCNLHLVKPIRKADLLHHINKLIEIKYSSL